MKNGLNKIQTAGYNGVHTVETRNQRQMCSKCFQFVQILSLSMQFTLEVILQANPAN